jgi:hypothetical protein
MISATVVLGVSYIILAIAHTKEIEACKRKIWATIHSLVLSVVGFLYIFGMVPHP